MTWPEHSDDACHVVHRNPSTVPAPIGRYDHVTVTPPGSSLAFISGQVGIDHSGQAVAADAVSQTRQAYGHIAALLDDVGVGPAAIIKLLTLVVGSQNVREVLDTRDEIFDAWYPNGDVPAHSLAVVEGLAAPELLVEIESVAVITDRQPARGSGR